MLIFVSPAYNEELNIGKLIDKTHHYCAEHKMSYHQIIVDDGSVDNTAEIVKRETQARSLPVTLIRYHPNRGAGEAFRAGLTQALSLAKEEDILVTMESDGTSDLEILPALSQKIAQGADVVIGSCHARGGRMLGNAWHRVFLSRCANILITTLFSMRGLTTLSSFYRAYRPSALRKVLQAYGSFSEERTFSFVVEILIRFARLGLKIEEVPMTLDNEKRLGKSKMKIMKNMMGYLRITRRNLVSKNRLKFFNLPIGSSLIFVAEKLKG